MSITRAVSDVERLLELSIAKCEALHEQRTASQDVQRLQRQIDRIDEEAREIRANPTVEAA